MGRPVEGLLEVPVLVVRLVQGLGAFGPHLVHHRAQPAPHPFDHPLALLGTGLGDSFAHPRQLVHGGAGPVSLDRTALAQSLDLGTQLVHPLPRLSALVAQGRQVVVDTSGPPLRAALGAGLALIKPSRGEFEAMVGRPLNTPKALGDAALAVVREGQAGLVVVSLGQEGALLAEPTGVTRLPALDVPALGAVGAGDSFTAGMVLALARGEAPRAAFAWGMAAGAAAVMRPGTARPRPEDVAALRATISLA